MGSDNETPTKANIPAWALNPDYTVHATTSKPDDSHYRAIFDIFNKSDAAAARKDSASSHKSITDVAQSTPQQQQPPSSPRAQSEPPKAKKNSSTTRL